jgi:outer membrane protein assembly factor BamB
LLLQGRGAGISLRVPIIENTVASLDDNAPFAGELTASDGVPSQIHGSWPGFRGANLDAVVKADMSRPFNLDWEKNKPKTLWEIKLGEGYAVLLWQTDVSIY